MTPTLSIIVLCFNKFNFTKSCLADLFQLPSDTHEIILFDNGSTDQTQSECSKIERPNFHYIRSETNFGFAGGCNRAYATTNASNVLFLNNDIRVKTNHTNWTAPIIKHCEYALVGPTMGELDQQFNFIREANKELTSKNAYLSGWCLASSKKILDRLRANSNNELFSEEFFAYFEDTDLSFRAKDMNIPIKIVDVPVVHFGRQTGRQLNLPLLYKTSKETFTKKWAKHIKK